jgi:hypothetical protein
MQLPLEPRANYCEYRLFLRKSQGRYAKSRFDYAHGYGWPLFYPQNFLDIPRKPYFYHNNTLSPP